MGITDGQKECRLCKRSLLEIRTEGQNGGFYLRGKYICSSCESMIVSSMAGSDQYDILIEEIKQLLLVS